MMARFVVLLVFLIVLQVVGAVIGLSFPAGEWYQALNKPAFTPDPSLFGVVWPVLYGLVAIAGWLVFTSGGKVPGWGSWVVQLLLNWAWSPVFFGLQSLALSVVVLAFTLGFSISFMRTVFPHSILAGLCFVPYVFWLGFALALNGTIWALN